MKNTTKQSKPKQFSIFDWIKAIIDTKPSWGKEQIKQLAIITLNDVLLGNLDKEQSENTQN
jgi:hypothetical protein